MHGLTGLISKAVACDIVVERVHVSQDVDVTLLTSSVALDILYVVCCSFLCICYVFAQTMHDETEMICADKVVPVNTEAASQILREHPHAFK